MSAKKRDISSLEERARITIDRYSMISEGDSILVGVSGGPDSVALLLLLKDMACSDRYGTNAEIARSQDKHADNPGGYSSVKPGDDSSVNHEAYSSVKPEGDSAVKIAVAHVNHCLRGEESDRDEKFVIELAEELDIVCHSIRVDVPAVAKENKLSFEEAARNVRYSFYREMASIHGYNRVALGHNCDDNAELVLMNMIRGSGTKGISGIPPVREKFIIRPLIDVSREEILEYLRSKGQGYVIDSSNNETDYLRNRVRHLLIPELKSSYNPGIVDSLNRLSRILMDESAWMEDEVERVFRGSLLPSEAEAGVILVKRDSFIGHPALARRLARRAVKEVKGDLRRISMRHVDDMLELILKESGGSAIHLPDRIIVIRKKDIIHFRKESRPLREVGRGA